MESNNRVQMKLSTKQMLTYQCRRQIHSSQGVRGWGGISWGIGIDIYTVLDIK